jgi:hypothetical protein
MGLRDQQRSNTGHAIADVLRNGGRVQVVIGADGKLVASSQEISPTSPPTATETADGETTPAREPEIIRAPDLTPEDVDAPGFRIGFDGRPITPTGPTSGSGWDGFGGGHAGGHC